MMPSKNIVIVGGGAAGFFAAITAAQHAKDHQLDCQVTLLEASSRFLQKVKISGGGRCNVTHDDFDIRSFVQRYPRGNKELISPMHQFQAKDIVAWFEQRGVALKTENDGRMFPTTDLSSTIIDCLMEEAEKLGVQTDLRFRVEQLEKNKQGFVLKSATAQKQAEAVLLATGSSPHGYDMAKGIGHHITQRAPSLFSVKIPEADLQSLQGTAFTHAKVTLTLKDTSFTQEGPLLITHWGLSGPVILKLSAWAAREMMDENYYASITVNWGNNKHTQAQKDLHCIAKTNARSLLQKYRLKGTTQRFWSYILKKSGVDPGLQYANLSNKQAEAIVSCWTQQEYQVTGKNRYKDEFVECGGVDLKEVDLKTMQSKKIPGLFFAGEIMDVDGLTGGFNLQHAWTSGYIAGKSMVAL